WSVASERKPPRVPPPRMRLATITTVQRENMRPVCVNRRSSASHPGWTSRAGLSVFVLVKARKSGARHQLQPRLRRGPNWLRVFFADFPIRFVRDFPTPTLNGESRTMPFITLLTHRGVVAFRPIPFYLPQV